MADELAIAISSSVRMRAFAHLSARASGSWRSSSLSADAYSCGTIVTRSLASSVRESFTIDCINSRMPDLVALETMSDVAVTSRCWRYCCNLEVDSDDACVDSMAVVVVVVVVEIRMEDVVVKESAKPDEAVHRLAIRSSCKRHSWMLTAFASLSDCVPRMMTNMFCLCDVVVVDADEVANGSDVMTKSNQ